MNSPRTLSALVAGLVLTLLTAALSRAPVTLAGESDRVLRLSWRTEGVSVEVCRDRTEEELAALPAHMRTPTECSGGRADYELAVTIDGVSARIDTLRSAGARSDRPIFVLEDIPLPPSTSFVEVRFSPLIPDGVPLPPGAVALRWAAQLTLAPGEVAMLTVAGTGRDLELLAR